MSKSTQQIRKLVAIMFTDMVGYSALTQKNEALALELLEEHRQLVRPIFLKHKGKEIETAGDSFFVEFGSALEATRSAIEIQQTLFQHNEAVNPERRIRLRIGLHLGDVVHQGKHVHGDGVNIAARIEPCAEPGGVCISEDVARQVQNKIELPIRKLDKKQLKNIQLQVEIYEIQFPWSPAQAERGSSSLLTRAESVNQPTSKRSKLTWIVSSSVVALIAIIVALFFFKLKSESVRNKTIAVLPFINVGGKVEEEYFSDGMTDDILTQLGKIAALKVISRTTMMQYKGSTKGPRDIGKELNAGVVLEGRVRRVADQVRITAQLIDASNDEALWSESYDKEFRQIFAIQSDVARRIAKSLEATLSPDEKKRLERQPTDNLEAYDLYLQGRYYWNQRLPDKLKMGIKYFNLAIEKDSTYALAYAGLADCYTLLGNLSIHPPGETYPKAIAAAATALALNDELAEAHASLAFAKMNYDWDWPGAEAEFKRAIELDPSYATARSWYALLFAVGGRFEEAFAMSEQAQKLDPFSFVISADAALILYFARDYEKAIEQSGKTLEMNPTFGLANVILGGAYLQQSKFKKAIDTLSWATLFTKGHPIAVAALGNAYARAGRREDASTMLDLLQDQFAQRDTSSYWVGPYWIAVVYAGLGEKGHAFEWLEKAYAHHDGALVFLKVVPVFDDIRSDPKFTALLTKMRLER